MPSRQIRTGIPFLQRVSSDVNNIPNTNNIVLGRNNNVNNTNNLIVGDGNSSAGNVQVFGNRNILNQSSNSMVIGSDNFVFSNASFVLGSSNSVSSFNNNVFLMGVSNLNLTQSISDVYMIGPGSAPTQSGIFLNNNVFLGPSVSIFNSSGITISGQNLNQVLTFGNSTGGLDIQMDDAIIFDSSGNSIGFDSTNGVSIVSSDDIVISTGAGNNIVLQSGATGIVEVITNAEEQFTFNAYAFKEISIGDWDMDSTANLNVNHNLSATEYKTIRNIQVTIRDDNDDEYFDLSQDTGNAGIVNGGFYWNSTKITLGRTTGGAFDNSSFDATASFNRGWIRFQYRPD